ncbi:MAG TPA: dimethyl sulfoxide reductase anchor subunit [Rhizobiales bacterium]|nr:dimethyl sulfoxide reductase anchor subunit [Hyphomicrobiales bacterium]
MHPALSVIVFTTVSGLGYGLAAVLGLGVLDAASWPTRIAHVLALAAIAGGLLSSTLHLGNPQRAWRAFSQWRSSWLSREGVLAVSTFLPLTVSAWMSVIEGRYLPVWGLLGTAGSIATVFSTAMIYTSLKSVQAWHTPLTVAGYLSFAAAGGLLLATAAAYAAGSDAAPALAIAGIVALAAAWAIKGAWWRRQRRMKPISTAETATGLGSIGRVRLHERPHATENYLTREMGFRVARKHADKLERLALASGGVAPALLLAGATLAGGGLALALALLAVPFHAAGILAERWLFFATARHAVMNYYGR